MLILSEKRAFSFIFVDIYRGGYKKLTYPQFINPLILTT